MSTSYYALVKLSPQGTGMQLYFRARGTSEALNIMCQRAKVKGTEDIAEYELFEVVGTRKYRSVAMKPGPGRKKVEFTPPSPEGRAPQTQEESPPATKPHPVGPSHPEYTVSSI